ncbi:MAG: hypothetical protein IKU71_02985 [Kiritimatiellae bacterium]|nr:hypothetical protein [Kiritimatiellia bacterium]
MENGWVVFGRTGERWMGQDKDGWSANEGSLVGWTEGRTMERAKARQICRAISLSGLWLNCGLVVGVGESRIEDG